MRPAPALAALLLAAAGPALAQPAPDRAPPAADPADPAGAGSAQPAPRVLTLDEALALGLTRQPQLRRARAATEAARARVDQAFAPLLPQLGGSARWQRDSSAASRAFAVPGGSLATGDRELYSLGLSADLTLWDFGQTSGRWRAAQAGAHGQAATERATAQAVALAIRRAYFDAVAARALLGVARDTLANEERHLAQIRAFVEVGTRPPIDLVQERANVANARVRLIQAENSYATARVTVEQAIGAPDLGPWDVADSPHPPVPGEEASLELLLAEALAARPEVAALGEQARAQELTVRALQGSYGPSLGVSAGVTESGPRPSDLEAGWNTAVTLTWPIFQGGQTRGQVREARASVESIRADLEELRQSVRVEVEQARLGVRAAVAALGAAEEASQAARERLALAEGRYRTGVGSVLELSDAQLGLTTALGQQVQSALQLASARSALLRALGRP